MTTILEEDEGHIAPVDFSQLLQDITLPGTSDVSLPTAATTEPLGISQCPLHPDVDDCQCTGFVGDWDLPESASGDALGGIQEPDYSRFDHWIPRFIFPEKACDYCRSRRLNCYVQRGEPFCTPCRTLFRECSFTGSNTLESTNYVDKPSGTFLDTLHLVDEDQAQPWGGLTGVKQLRSKNSGSGTATPVRDDAPGSSKRNGIRFPRHAVKILRDWLDEHAENPYPTEEEKADLERQTDLKPSQIANWLANARRRRKVTEKSKPRLCASPSLRPTTCPIPIPSTPDKTWDDMNPFERWQHSPPENEPADLSDIAIALAKNDVPADDVSTSPSTLARSKRRKASSNDSGFSNARAPSLTSQETGQTSTLSASSARFSNGSSHSTHGSFGSFSSGLAGKKDRRRRRRQAPAASSRKATDEGKRIFQCTFCTDTFKSKYDWTRHEKSLHLSLEKWICAPLGPVLTDQESGNKKCVYCELHNPSSDHLESHNHRQCEDKGLDARTFYRKDHLRQHLRLMHGCEMAPAMDKWKFTAVNINSRCGFCAQRFSTWQERVDHLTAHFKAGARMSEWKGCRGLDPAVAAQVTNAMPPYLIGIESVSPNPFSATNRTSWRSNCPQEGEFREGEAHSHNDMQDAHDGTSSKATCWEILTVRLGKYAKRMADEHVQMSDDMLQTEARRILYDSDDSWNQTAADNPEWLDLFKKAHGLDFIPAAIGGQGKSVPEDLETYGDLGLRIPFAVQLQAYNKSQSGQQRLDAATRPGPYKAAVEKRKARTQQMYEILSTEGVLHNETAHCKHTECAKNILDTNMIDGIEPSPAEARKWCDQDITPEMRRQLASISCSEATLFPSLDSLAVDGQAAAAGRARGLAALTAHEQTHTSCEWEQQDRILEAARARTRGLEALARAEAPLTGDGLPKAASPAIRQQLGYLPRHKLELPKEKANLFATTTNAWEDAGVMPQTVVTSLANIPETTSTGAMMEFLGGNIGASLPFSNDALTSTIDLPAMPSAADLDWHLPDVSQEEMMDLINSTASGQFDNMPDLAGMDMNWPTDNFAPAVGTADAAGDLTMHDIAFDDMNFDSVFDMPLDETFGPESGLM